MDFIVPLYLVAGIFAIAISVPSIFQLIKTKRSDELSLSSWIGWIIYQVIALFYSIHINATLYIIINTLWISFYTVMVLFIIKYRVKPKRTRRSNKKLKRKII